MKRIIFSSVSVVMLIVMMLPAVSPPAVLADVPEYKYWDTWSPEGGPKSECERAGGCCEATSATKIEWDENNGKNGTYGPITISNSDGYSFTWSSTQLVTCVIIKAGTPGHIFRYCPDGAYGGALDLRHYLPQGEKLHAISHVTFCFGEAPEARIDVEKEVSATIAEPGDTLTFTIFYKNTGNMDATGVVITDVVDTNLENINPQDGGIYDAGTRTVTWSIGDVAVDTGGSVSFTADIVSPLDDGTIIYNTGTIDSDQTEPEDTNTTETEVESPPPPPGPAGGGGCPSTKYLTVDWEGNNTTKPLYSNDKLAVDLLGPSFDLSHNLFLERGTHAPVVYKTTHYVIIVRELAEIPAVPENMEAIVVFNITPANAEFNKNIFLTLGVDELPANALNVTMAYYDDVNDAWVFLESEAGGPNGVAELTLSAPINHFSIFGVLAELEPTPPPQPAHFVASGLSIEPSVERIWEPVTFVTKTGESVTITANVANDGWQEGTYTVELKLNGETVDTKMVTVGAGQSKPVSFTVSGLDYGQYDVEVAGLDGEFTASRTITWWLIILLIVAIGLIIWGVVWGRRRRRARQQA